MFRKWLITIVGLLVLCYFVKSDEYFKEKVLSPLYWGMSRGNFKIFYTEIDSTIESVPNYFTQMYFPFYGHVGPAGFHFSEDGLFRIVISYVFRIEGKILNDEEILQKSERIYRELTLNYEKPILYSPWDGKMFEYIWNKKETIIIFAWDGSSSWSLQFRSKKLDPEAPTILDYIKWRKECNRYRLTALWGRDHLLKRLLI